MPELSQNFVVPFPRAEVWRVFHDVSVVAGCMPGAALDKIDEDGKLRGQMRVKLGPITAAFAGEAEHEMDDAVWAGVIHGTGRDPKNNSRARADVRFNLTEQDQGTRVDVVVNYTLAGMLAQFSRGSIVQSVAQRLTEEFARNLATAMETRSSDELTPQQETTPVSLTRTAERPAISTPVEPAPGGAPPRAEEIKLFGVLWSVFMSWLHRRLGRLLGRRSDADG
jgi:carbon monoxide dehydrogenase subunit G